MPFLFLAAFFFRLRLLFRFPFLLVASEPPSGGPTPARHGRTWWGHLDGPFGWPALISGDALRTVPRLRACVWHFGLRVRADQRVCASYGSALGGVVGILSSG